MSNGLTGYPLPGTAIRYIIIKITFTAEINPKFTPILDNGITQNTLARSEIIKNILISIDNCIKNIGTIAK